MRELLKHAHGIVGAQYGDRTREPDALRYRGDCREGCRRRGDEIVGAVMLADGEYVESEFVSELRLFEEVPHPLLWGDPEARSAKVATPSSTSQSIADSCGLNHRWRLASPRPAAALTARIGPLQGC